MPIPLGVPGAQICIEIPGSTGLYWGSMGAQVYIGGIPGAQVPYWRGPWVILVSE